MPLCYMAIEGKGILWLAFTMAHNFCWGWGVLRTNYPLVCMGGLGYRLQAIRKSPWSSAHKWSDAHKWSSAPEVKTNHQLRIPILIFKKSASNSVDIVRYTLAWNWWKRVKEFMSHNSVLLWFKKKKKKNGLVQRRSQYCLTHVKKDRQSW